jgi:hypothetical protein
VVGLLAFNNEEEADSRIINLGSFLAIPSLPPTSHPEVKESEPHLQLI